MQHPQPAPMDRGDTILVLLVTGRQALKPDLIRSLHDAKSMVDSVDV